MNLLGHRRRSWLGVHIFLSFWFSHSLSTALSATNGVTRYGVRIWQIDDGLPNNSVLSLAQSPDGYLWVGTQQGLARFDGMRFAAVDEASAPELRRNAILALCASRDGSLWVACEGAGLFRLRQRSVSHFREPDGLPSLQIKCLLEDKDGVLWIGTDGGGLTQFKAGKFTTYTDKNGLGSVFVRSICQDHNGAIRAATLRGLATIVPSGAISTVNYQLGTVANSLKGVCEDQEGNVWVTSNDGLICDGAQGRKSYAQSEGLPDRKATAAYCDRDGAVWIGTYSGLVCLVGGVVVAKPLNDAGFGDLVYTICQDQEDNLWVGARDGLYRVSAARVTTYATQEGLSSNNAMSVLEDRDGVIWIATWGGGLNELKDGKFHVFGTTNGLTHDSVLSLCEARAGGIYAGMDFDGGLNLLSAERRNVFPKLNGTLSQVIHVVYEDRRGGLWVGTRYGLNVVRDGNVKNYNAAKGLAGNLVMAIHEDTQGTMWIGTDGGLSRWDGHKFNNLTVREGLSTNAVDAIYEAKDGTLWLGTKGGGVNRLKDGKLTAYATRQGLFSDEVYEILEDDFGCFWMSCRSGIFRVNKQDFDAVDSGKNRAVSCTVFGKADGLVSVQCNGVSKPAGWKSRDGRLWFPTIRGVVAIESRIKTNDKPPPVVIEEVIVDRVSYGGRNRDRAEVRQPGAGIPLETLRIPPGRGELDIHFTALSFSAPEKNHFKYKLEGVDPDWIDGDTRREAFYNHIEHGNYTFKVIASNNDGVWNQVGAAVPLIFLPHYWQTWWFKAAVPVSVILLLAAWYRARVARLREIELLRIQIAADLHDDVGSRLTKVAMVTELVERETNADAPSKPLIQNIAQTTREVIQAMDEIVWTINPRNDTLDNLANYVFQYAQEYFQNTSVRCRMHLPARLPDRPLSTEQRHNLFMAVKEALNNVLKHSHANEVRISLAINDADISIQIVDNGCGFSKQLINGGGNGLQNMEQRLERIGGRLKIESQPGGGGTRVEMETKLN